MPKAQTKRVEIEGITINIPVGSMDTPSEWSQEIMRQHSDSRGWKFAVSEYCTYDRGEADDLAYCYDFYLGGHETIEEVCGGRTLYRVSSKGYYHYIGA